MQDLKTFEAEVRDFIAARLTPELRRAGLLCAGVYADQPVANQWLRILNEKGWAAPHWPVEHGGTDWSHDHHEIFQRELTLACAPSIGPNATRMVGPAIIAFGTPEQKAHYLPRILSGEDWWAQGFSEPGAGSDLASLQTSAVRDGDDYVLNGSKIWTTHAQWSNKMFGLFRTDTSGKKQQGISFLLFDLDLPGVEVRPLISMSGDHEFNQVFFNDARIPASGLLGPENDGWTVAKYLLQHERGGQMATMLGMRLQRIRDYATAPPDGAAPLIRDPEFSGRLAAAEIELAVLDAYERHVFSAMKAGDAPGVTSSVLKIRQTELRQRTTELAIEMVGAYALPYQPEVREFGANVDALGSMAAAIAMPQYLNDRAATIYAGSNEIQRNILTKAVLGL